MEEEHHNRPVEVAAHSLTGSPQAEREDNPVAGRKEVVDTAVVAERGSEGLLAQGLVQQQVVEQARDQRLR